MYNAVTANIKKVPVIIIFFSGNFPAVFGRILSGRTVCLITLHNFPTETIAT
jgi:hypothetical protein